MTEYLSPKESIMDLSELIERLSDYPADHEVEHGFGSPHSWRGSYDELSFEPVNDTTVGDMLANARSALDATFHGWKGGSFQMVLNTPCHVNYQGEWSDDDALTELLLSAMLGENPSWGRWPQECEVCGETRRGYHWCSATQETP